MNISDLFRDRDSTGGDRIILVELVAGDKLVSVGLTSSGPHKYEATVTTESKSNYTTLDEQMTSALRRVSLNILRQARPSIMIQDIKHFSAVLTPMGGYELAGLPSKYAADLKSRSPFEVKIEKFMLRQSRNCDYGVWQNLYLCGGDVSSTGFSGDIQGGWIAANAALGLYLFLFFVLCCCREAQLFLVPEM